MGFTLVLVQFGLFEQPPDGPPGVLVTVVIFPATTWSSCAFVSFTGSALAEKLSAPRPSSASPMAFMVVSSSEA